MQMSPKRIEIIIEYPTSKCLLKESRSFWDDPSLPPTFKNTVWFYRQQARLKISVLTLSSLVVQKVYHFLKSSFYADQQLIICTTIINVRIYTYKSYLASRVTITQQSVM